MRPLILGLAAAAATAIPALSAPVPAASAALTPFAQSSYFSIRNTQDLLNRLGYDAGPADGIMGSRTSGAIMAYQRDEGLPVTGQADATLYSHILATLSQGGGATAGSGTIAIDSDVVIEVQAELRRRGYSIPAVSGQLDQSTRSAVASYQRAVGMPATGVIDSALVASLRGTESGTTTAERTLVRDVQQALARRGYDPGRSDGYMSQQTASAIRTYQADNGLAVTGTASQSLLARLEGGTTTSGYLSERQTVMAVQEELIARGYLKGKVDGVAGAATSAAIRAFEQDAGLAVTGTPSASLLSSLRATDLTRRTAARQSRILEIEQQLAAKGYRIGPADGVMDAQTEAAIRTFQRDAGIRVDGKADDEVLKALRNTRVTARPLTPEQAIMGTTIRLLDQLGSGGQSE